MTILVALLGRARPDGLLRVSALFAAAFGAYLAYAAI